MDINILQNAISDLENADTTLDNIKELACLYIIVENFKHTEERIINEAVDKVTAELHDILPQYRRYREIKRNNCLTGTVTTEYTIKALCEVCKEFNEFITTLYVNTDTEEERKIIKDSIAKVLTSL